MSFRVARQAHAALALVALCGVSVGWPLSTTRAAVGRGIVQGGMVTVAEVGAPDTLNPLFSQSSATSADVTSAVFDSLLRVTPQGTLGPDLATGYDRSPDGLHWTFMLRHNVTWHDGAPFTARDVVYTARLANAGVGAAVTLGFDHIRSIQALGDDRVVVTLISPYAPFLSYYATAPVVPEHVLGPLPLKGVRTYSAFNRRPIGTGPFAVSAYSADRGVTLTANPTYFGGKPRLDGITFRFLSSGAVALHAIADGSADVVGPSINMSPGQFVALQQRGGLHTFAAAGAEWSHLDLVQSGFLVDKAVRRALAYATPKAELVRTVLLGLGDVADADQPPHTRYYNPAVRNSYPFSIATARRLLVADGFRLGRDGFFAKNGRPLAITLWGDSASPDVRLTLRLIQHRWQQAGVAATVSLVDQETLFGQAGPLYNPNRFTSTGMNAVYFEWINGFEPEDSYFWQSSQIVTPQHPAGGNYVGYSNPLVDALTAQAAHASDDATRVKLYNRIQQLLAQDQPVIFLAWHRVLTVTAGRMHGYVPNPYLPQVAWNAQDWYLVSP